MAKFCNLVAFLNVIVKKGTFKLLFVAFEKRKHRKERKENEEINWEKI
jgi:hypothetical protein